MAVIVPSISDLRNLILGDADALLQGTEPRLARSLLNTLLMAPVGALHEAYGHLADDLFPDTARSEALDRWATIYGLTRGSATFSQGWLGADGASPGVIPLGTRFRTQDGREFQRVDVGIFPNGTAAILGTGTVDHDAIGVPGPGWYVPVRAVRSGSDGNVLAGSTLSFISPLVGFDPTLSAPLGITGAVDTETDASLRERIVERIQNPPQGGTASEYEQWALAASTPEDPITRAFVVPPAPGDNTVTVYIVDDGGGLPAANPPTPTAQAIANVESYIDERRPLSSQLVVAVPTFVNLGLEIALSPDTAAIRTAIENELDAWLIDTHTPGLELPISILQERISIAAGGGEARLVAPTVNYAPNPDEILTRGGITYS